MANPILELALAWLDPCLIEAWLKLELGLIQAWACFKLEFKYLQYVSPMEALVLLELEFDIVLSLAWPKLDRCSIEEWLKLELGLFQAWACLKLDFKYLEYVSLMNALGRMELEFDSVLSLA